MKNWLTNLFSHPKPSEPTASTFTEMERLSLEKSIQSLRMEIAERDQTIANLRQEVERLRQRQESIAAETAQSRLEGFFTDLAAPASQVMTQADLLEKQNKPVQARDVLAVARRMVRALERNGLAFDGQIGQQLAFDPNRHTPINNIIAPQAGQPVTIRFMGVAYQGKIIYKAMVE